jgi:hypothetical protein
MTFLRTIQERSATLAKSHPRWSIVVVAAAIVLLVLVVLALISSFAAQKPNEQPGSAANSYVRQLQLQQDVQATVRNVEVAAAKTGDLSKIVKQESIIGIQPKLYDGPVPTITVKATNGSDFAVRGSDPATGYTYTYDSDTKRYTSEQAIRSTPQPAQAN